MLKHFENSNKTGWYHLSFFSAGRHSGARESSDLNSPNFLSHQSSNLYIDPKMSPVHKRGSASPSPSVNSLGKDHSLRNSVELSNARLFDTGVHEITDIPDDYLSQSSVLKHLAKEVKIPSPQGTAKKNEVDGLDLLKEPPLKFDANIDFGINNLPPPPEYPKWINKSSIREGGRNKISAEKISLSKSQPDLSTFGLNKSDFNGFRRGVSVPRPKTKGREEYDCATGEMWPSAEIVEILIKENSALKHEVEQCYQKVAKSQKVSCLMMLRFLIFIVFHLFALNGISVYN